LPSISALQGELKGRGFTVLLVNIAEGLEKVTAPVEERGYRLRVLLDTDGRTSHAYRVIATPTVFLTGRDGALLGRAIGPRSWTKEPARTLLEKLLKGTGTRSHVEVARPPDS
jgi:hypothetical protein